MNRPMRKKFMSIKSIKMLDCLVEISKFIIICQYDKNYHKYLLYEASCICMYNKSSRRKMYEKFFIFTFAQELVDSLNKHHILNIDAFKLYSFEMHFVIGSELSGHYIAPHSSLKIYQIVVFK